MRLKRLSHMLLATLIAFQFSSSTSHAGLGKWFKREVVPTVRGDRKLRIRPSVTIKHGSKFRAEIGRNRASIRVGNVTVKTHQLKKRLAQIGCIYATSGDVVRCAPDILERELSRIAAGHPLNPKKNEQYPRPRPPIYVPRDGIAKWVDSRRGWQRFDTYVPVTQILEITGGWSVDAARYRPVGSEGHTGADAQSLRPHNARKFVPELPFGALIMYIDGYGYSGIRPNMILPRPVQTFLLRINDRNDSLGDNAGKLIVHVR